MQNRLNIRSVVTSTKFLPTYLQDPGQGTLDALPLTLGDLENGDPFVPAYEDAGFNQNFLTVSCLMATPYITDWQPN